MAAFLLLVAVSTSAQLRQIQSAENPLGGAIDSLAVNPRDGKDILAGSRRGGLFRSHDGGLTWRWIASPSSDIKDVSFSPTAPGVIIYAALHNTGVTQTGGVFRSGDDGATWDPAPAADGCSAATPNAYSISWVPNTNIVWVATDCGILRSFDGGAHWGQLIHPDLPQFGAFFTILATGRHSVVAGGANGYYMTANETSWRKSTTNAADPGAQHALAVMPGNSSIVFRGDATMPLQVSRDGGFSWTNFAQNSNFNPGGNQPPFVALTPVPGDSASVDLFYSDGFFLFERMRLKRDPASWPAASQRIPLNTAYDHTDVAHMVFDKDGRPFLAACDGGVMIASQGGDAWKMTGGGTGGLNALEITGIGVQKVASPPHEAMQYITWHNSGWLSKDRGAHWFIGIGAEGYGVQEPLDVATPAQAIFSVHYAQSPPESLFDESGGKPAYPYPQGSTTAGNTTFFRSRGDWWMLHVTYNTPAQIDVKKASATSWQHVWTETTQKQFNGYARTAQVADEESTTMYLGYVDGNGRNRLFKLLDITGTPRVEDIVMLGISSLGTMSSYYGDMVFDVKPDDDQVVIAVDSAGKVYRSFYGGVFFLPLDQATNLLQSNGALALVTAGQTQADQVAFDPWHPNNVYIGTEQAGVLFSPDAGNTWSVIQGTQWIPHVMHFAFDGDYVYFGSEGRGLWEWKPTAALLAYHGQIAAPAAKTPTAALTFDGASAVAGTWRAKPRQTLVVRGRGFHANESVSIALNGRGIASVTTDEKGTFQTPVTIDVPPGSARVTAVQGTVQASQPLVILSRDSDEKQ